MLYLVQFHVHLLYLHIKCDHKSYSNNFYFPTLYVMSAQTPSRISLRRKRLCNEFESNGPSPKRISPAKKDQFSDKEKNEKKEIIETDKSLIAATFMTPKSYNKRGVKRNAETPKTHREIEIDNPLENKNECNEPEFSLSQSPQFPSSQIPSTQDWEVVWDCNSPGYSKEELKKMGDCQSDKLSNSSPIVPVSNRLHFSRLRRPPLSLSPIHLPSRLNSKNSLAVAAELDSLLIKVNGERIQQDQCQSDDSDPLPNDISNILNASSQPFDVSNLEENLNHSVNNTKEEKLENDFVSHHEASTPLVKNELKEETPEANTNFLSFDDDDLFSESFLISTQALEESVLRKEPEAKKSNFTANKNFSPLSRIRKKTPTVIDGREVTLEKSNDGTDSPLKPKSFNNYKIRPVTSSPMSSKINNTIKGNISSVADNISDHTRNKAKPNLQNNLDTSDSLNTKTRDKNLPKISGFKTIKPRATFQLNIPSSQSLNKLFTSKFSKSESSSSYYENENATYDNSHVINASNNGKFNRSKSESSHLTSNVTKLKSCNSLIESNIGAHVTQELDDDDEVFASLMPALIEVEAEHEKKLSQESKINSAETTTARSAMHSNVNRYSIPSVSDKTFSFHNSRNQYSQMKPSSLLTKSMTKNSSNSSSSCSSDIKSYNKSLCADKFPTVNKSYESEERACNSKGVTKSCILNQKNSTSDFIDQKTETENKRPENLPDKFEDEDDDIFLQDGVLDYLTQVESQFISSQSSSQKCDAKPSTIVKESSSSKADSANSSVSVNKGKGLCKIDVSSENYTSKEESNNDSLDKSRYENPIIDRGSKKLVNEFVKVSETAAKLKRVLNCDSSKSFIEEKIVSKRTSPRRNNSVKSPQNSESFLSDEDMFNAFETSVEDMPTKSSGDQTHKDKFPVSKKHLQLDVSGSSGNNKSSIRINNNNNSSMSNLQVKFCNTHNTRSRNLASNKETQITLSNKIKAVSKTKIFSTINTRGTSHYTVNVKSNNK